MNRTTATKIAAFACCMVVAIGLLVGCMGSQGAAANSEQRANRNYMSQVNQTMEKLNEQLDAFVDAVSRDDIVAMRAQAENAYKVLDELAAIEAPDALSDVKEGYVQGSSELREALDGYITLYTDMKSSEASVDSTTYEKRLAEVQDKYNKGVETMKAADEAAAAKQ